MDRFWKQQSKTTLDLKWTDFGNNNPKQSYALNRQILETTIQNNLRP